MEDEIVAEQAVRVLNLQEVHAGSWEAGKSDRYLILFLKVDGSIDLVAVYKYVCIVPDMTSAELHHFVLSTKYREALTSVLGV